MKDAQQLTYEFTREIDVAIEVLVHENGDVELIKAWDPQTKCPVSLTKREIESITTPTKFGQKWSNHYDMILDEAESKGK